MSTPDREVKYGPADCYVQVGEVKFEAHKSVLSEECCVISTLDSLPAAAGAAHPEGAQLNLTPLFEGASEKAVRLFLDTAYTARLCGPGIPHPTPRGSQQEDPDFAKATAGAARLADKLDAPSVLEALGENAAFWVEEKPEELARWLAAAEESGVDGYTRRLAAAAAEVMWNKRPEEPQLLQAMQGAAWLEVSAPTLLMLLDGVLARKVFTADRLAAVAPYWRKFGDLCAAARGEETARDLAELAQLDMAELGLWEQAHIDYDAEWDHFPNPAHHDMCVDGLDDFYHLYHAGEFFEQEESDWETNTEEAAEEAAEEEGDEAEEPSEGTPAEEPQERPEQDGEAGLPAAAGDGAG